MKIKNHISFIHPLSALTNGQYIKKNVQDLYFIVFIKIIILLVCRWLLQYVSFILIGYNKSPMPVYRTYRGYKFTNLFK